MTNHKKTLGWHPSKSGLNEIAHANLAKPEYMLLLYMIAHCELQIIKGRDSLAATDHIGPHPLIPPGFIGIYVFSENRSAIAEQFDGWNPRTVSVHISKLVKRGYLIRSGEFSLRLMFAFIISPRLFCLED